MARMLKQSLSQKQLQKLSPQQIQLMKLLQIPSANLEQRIKEELELNPALEEAGGEGEEISIEVNVQQTEDVLPTKAEVEEGISLNEDDTDLDRDTDESTELELGEDDVNIDEYLEGDDIADYKTKDSGDYNPDDEEKNRTLPVPVEVTFHEQLISQLGLLDIDDREYVIAEQIIGSMDEDGYLRRALDAIVDDLAFSAGISTSEKEVEQILLKIQLFEPAGIGARDLKECLLLQLRRKEKNVIINVAINIIEAHFEAFTKKHYDRLSKDIGVQEDLLKKAVAEILHLNPKPGGAVDTTSKFHTYIIPDFIIANQNDELILTLNSLNAPELSVSNDFKDMLKSYKNSKDKSQKEALVFIKQKLDSAKWFIDAIKQRQQTMMSTMETIMKKQRRFFLSGDESDLRPMILKDIAEITGYDISTISRVANSKYVQTEFGTFLLKFFFSEALATSSGEEVSTREVKKILSDFIANESKKRPLSDEQLTAMLTEKGYNIARRTVAKYREQLNLPVARLRKEM